MIGESPIGLDIFETLGIFILVTVLGIIGNTIFILVYSLFHQVFVDYMLITVYSMLQAIFFFILMALGK